MEIEAESWDYPDKNKKKKLISNDTAAIVQALNNLTEAINKL